MDKKKSREFIIERIDTIQKAADLYRTFIRGSKGSRGYAESLIGMYNASREISVLIDNHNNSFGVDDFLDGQSERLKSSSLDLEKSMIDSMIE